MIITNIELKNWKNFVGVNVACGKRMFLIGPNASGKSNFLDALRFLRDIAQDGIEKAVLARGGISAVRSLSARSQPDITVAVTLDDVWKYSLTFGTEKSDPLAPLVRREAVYKRSGFGVTTWKPVLERPTEEDRTDTLRLTQTALQQINANAEFREVAEFFSSIQYRHILPQLVREPKAFSPSPISNDPYGRDLVQAIWNASKRTRDSRLGKINEALKVAVPQLENLTVKQDRNGIPHFEVNYAHWRKRGAYQSESSFSDGTLRLLALLWSILDTGGPLLLEEPELSLHEEIVAQLPSIFSRMDRDKKKSIRQIFVTTHSYAMLCVPGIGANEVIRFAPDKEGTKVLLPNPQETAAIQRGELTVADLLLPKTGPKNVEQLRLF
ncbi:MAG: AAA family ATPase [Proteobacteria bacterium]|nr:AAA family ATPase [Pseudomonadota bacterium]